MNYLTVLPTLATLVYFLQFKNVLFCFSGGYGGGHGGGHGGGGYGYGDFRKRLLRRIFRGRRSVEESEWFKLCLSILNSWLIDKLSNVILSWSTKQSLNR